MGRSRYTPPHWLLEKYLEEIPSPDIINGFWRGIIKTDVQPANNYPNIKADKGSNDNEFDQGQNAKRFTSFHLYIFLSVFICVYMQLFLFHIK